MTTLIIGMCLVVALAVLVVACVAVPQLREGKKWLTPRGQAQVDEARRRAAVMAVSARGRAAASTNKAAASVNRVSASANRASVATQEVAPSPRPPAAEPPDQRRPQRLPRVQTSWVARARSAGPETAQPGPRHAR